MSKIFQIAIDGPSGAGKSTIAKRVAAELAIDYIDTGAMYRAVGLKMLRLGIPMEENETLFEMLANTDVDFSEGRVYLDGEDVSDLIRTQEVSKAASDCSAFATVRRKLVELQQAMGKRKSVIMDGRDIGTVVLKDAEYKFYLTATAEERAMRRFKELQAKGSTDTYDKVLEDVNKRDYNDMHRDVDPLRQAEDAVLIDSTNMSIEEVVDFVIEAVTGEDIRK
ncbi:MAG: (d)CMP kinase [Firmicutes bacterium]|nr:(d)CMP kinase [Bacillota bacterium]MBR3260274.1 (d)CMP kinase [Bacillota bacterium]MBR6224936.1 (d)CMP kinase [Bacillota bacterium]